MLKHVLLFLLVLLGYLPLYAGQDTASLHHDPLPRPAASHLRISLITCGMGNEVYETFGHCCIRVIDSTQPEAQRDLIYNYGTFDHFDGGFAYKFLSGKMNVYLDTVGFRFFRYVFDMEKRSMTEQVLLLDDAQNLQLLAFLKNNALTENRYYKYDVFFDNCSTRTRDAFSKTFGSAFIFGDPLPGNTQVTLRTSYNRYYRHRYWERLGLNFLIGKTTDTVISKSSIMYIPDFLRIAVAGATLNGRNIAADPIIILEDRVNPTAPINEPLILTCLIAILTIAGVFYKKLYRLGRFMSAFVLVISGIMGCFIVYFWFISDFACAKDNFNLLWTLPTNMLLPFIRFKGRGVYALTGICLVFVSIILHLLKVQVIPMMEVAPLLVALLCAYFYIYRSSTSS